MKLFISCSTEACRCCCCCCYGYEQSSIKRLFVCLLIQWAMSLTDINVSSVILWSCIFRRSCLFRYVRGSLVNSKMYKTLQLRLRNRLVSIIYTRGIQKLPKYNCTIFFRYSFLKAYAALWYANMKILFIIFLSRVSCVLLVYTEAIYRGVCVWALHCDSRLNRWWWWWWWCAMI